MKIRPLLSVSLTLCFFAAISILHAQDYRGRVQGMVMDATQAVIPGANVSLINTKTGVTTSQKSNATGHYMFDYVDPGAYELRVDAGGFANFAQMNIMVQGRADITVNAILKPGAASQSVVVQSAPVSVEFHSSTMSTTIDQKMANDLPSLSRNPFEFAALDPSVLTTAYFSTLPYESWSAASMQIGGGSSYSDDTNEVLVDGSPVDLGAKTSYTPPMDAVQQVVIEQNPVDASYGNTAGGVMQVILKSGTNDWHGDVWYLGRYPFMQAWADRLVDTPNTTRQNMFGGSLGNPIIKNKLFNYFVNEDWKLSVPSSLVMTVPTAAQRQGDFSQTYTPNGALATIYDPMTSTYDPSTGTGSRTAFPGNQIPTSRMDPVALKIMQDMWAPNNPGDNVSGANNYKSAYNHLTNYYNFSDRADYYISDRWHVYGSVDHFKAIGSDTNPTPNQSPAFVSPDGSNNTATTISGDAVYTINPTTILTLHGDYNAFIDGYQNSQTLAGGYGSIWSSPWYTTFNVDAPTLYPRVVVNGSAFGSPWVYWYDSPHGESYSAVFSKQLNRHYLKFGFEDDHQIQTSISYDQNAFNFEPSMTADNFIQPQTATQGNGYASFLLGAMDPSSTVYTAPHGQPHWNYYALYAQDNYDVNQRLTLNLGLRWAYEAPLTDPQNRLGRYLDLSSPNPTLAANPPVMPSAVAQYSSSAPIYNGVYYFESSSHHNMYNAPFDEFMPRMGFALRINNNTSFRFGYGRFILPFSESSYSNSMGVNYPGLDASQSPLAPVLGVPQVFLQNPFPSTSPLVAPLGSQYDANYGLGSSISWYKQNYTPGANNRFDLSLQHELPDQVLVSATALLNYGYNMPLSYQANLANPNLLYQYKGALETQVANPFYQYGTPLTFAGPLRDEPTVSIDSLLTPYPQYGSLSYNNNIGGDRYQSIELKAQRPFTNGYNVLVAYDYNREATLNYWSDIQQYANQLSWETTAMPRQRLTFAGIYQLPFGRGRTYLTNASRPLEAIVGGWQLSSTFTYHSGDFLQIGNYQMSCNPAISNPTSTRWFNTSCFTLPPAFTPRSAPYFYSGLTGPRFWDLDASVMKDFHVTERIQSQLKMSSYNTTNTLMLADPDMNLEDTTFGEALQQSNFQTGRQTEIGLKLFF